MPENRLRCFRGIALAPGFVIKAPGNFHSRGEGHVNLHLVQPDKADEFARTLHLHGIRAVSVFFEMLLETVNQPVAAFFIKATWKKFHDHRVAVHPRKNLAVFEKIRDLVNIGAYVKGSDPEADTALLVNSALNNFLQQDVKDATPFEASLQSLTDISLVSVDRERLINGA